MRTSLTTAASRVRHWWQAYPTAGLIVGWIAIVVVGWRVWTALHGHAH